MPSRLRRGPITVGIAFAVVLVSSAIYLAQSNQLQTRSSKPTNSPNWERSPDPSFVGLLRSRAQPFAPLQPGQSCRPQTAVAPPSAPDLPSSQSYIGDGGALFVYGIDHMTVATIVPVTWVAPNGWGPVLIRGTRLDGPGQILFSRSNLARPDATELVLGLQIAPSASQWIKWTTYVYVSEAGCYAMGTDDGHLRGVVLFRAD